MTERCEWPLYVDPKMSETRGLLESYLDHLEESLVILENRLRDQRRVNETRENETAKNLTRGNAFNALLEDDRSDQERSENNKLEKKKHCQKRKEVSNQVEERLENSTRVPEDVVSMMASILHAQNDSNAYIKIKNWLVTNFSKGEMVELIATSIRVRRYLKDWDRAGACVLAALKYADEYIADIESIVSTFGQQFRELLEDSSVVGGQHDVRVAEARFIKRLLETLPGTSRVRNEICHSLSSLLCFKSSPSYRAIAVDLATLTMIDGFAKNIASNSLKPDAHRLVEEAVRRMASSTPERETLIGYVLVASLIEHRGDDMLFVSRTAKKFKVEDMFEGLGELGEQERVKSFVKQGVNKALGYVTLRPEKKWIVIKTLVEEGHHLTARRIANIRPNDDQMLMNLFGVEIDDEAAQEELERRKETCVRVPDDVSIVWIDSLESLMANKERILLAKGPLAADVEWLPEISDRQGLSPAQIIQFARRDAIYLLDVGFTSEMRKTSEFDEFMFELMTSVKAVWGFGLEMDCKVLSRTFPGSSWCSILRQKARNVSPSSNESLKGLAERILGKSVDKEQQMSDWSRRPLLPEQVEYAAADSYVLLLLHDVLFGDNGESLTFEETSVPIRPFIVQPVKHQCLPSNSEGGMKFFCDEQLKRVAKMLRAINIDCLYEPCGGKRSVALRARLAKAQSEGRIFLSSDNALKGMRGVYVLEAKDNEDRFHEIVQEFNIPLDQSAILLRCTKCNGPGFEVITRDEARALKPDVVNAYVYEVVDLFFRCSTCNNVVWQGKKFREVQARMERLISLVPQAHEPTTDTNQSE